LYGYSFSNTLYSSLEIDTPSTGMNTVITGAQIRMARAALKLGVRELAEVAGVAPMTISRLENGQSGGHGDTLAKIQKALENSGILFIAENGAGPGVRLAKRSTDETPSPEA
jgi:transcriptional regulator with XRE-family HTH domain